MHLVEETDVAGMEAVEPVEPVRTAVDMAEEADHSEVAEAEDFGRKPWQGRGTQEVKTRE